MRGIEETLIRLWEDREETIELHGSRVLIYPLDLDEIFSQTDLYLQQILFAGNLPPIRWVRILDETEIRCLTL